jgi:hypothetical protein
MTERCGTRDHRVESNGAALQGIADLNVAGSVIGECMDGREAAPWQERTYAEAWLRARKHRGSVAAHSEDDMNGTVAGRRPSLKIASQRRRGLVRSLTAKNNTARLRPLS